MVFEYMSLGDLAQLLRASNGNLFTKTKSPYHFKEVDNLILIIIYSLRHKRNRDRYKQMR